LFEVESLKARADAAFATKDLWHSTLRDAYEYFLPQREVFNYHSPGAKKATRIFDSTGQVAIKEFANRMMSTITPQGQIWAKMQPGLKHPKEIRTSKEVLARLDEVNKTLFDYIQQSNFYTIMGESYLDLAIGTAGITVDEGDMDSPLVFGILNQAEVGYEEGPTGVIENVFRRRVRKAAEIPRAYPNGEYSQVIMRAIDSKDVNKTIEITECMLFDPKKKEYWIVVYESESKQKIWEVPRGTVCPWPIFRWAVIHGEVRGRGPVLDALPDQKSLNKVKEFVLQKAAIELAGMWTGQDDGVFNPYTVNVTPGVVIPVSTNLTSNPSLQRLDTGGPLELTKFEVMDLQKNIKTHLYNDLRDPTGPVRSATEVAINQRDLAERIGSNFTRIQNEALVRILNASMGVLRRLGLVPDLKLDGRDIAIRFTSPLAQAQNVSEIQRFQESVMLTAQLAGPEAVNAAYKLNLVPSWIASKGGVDPELLNEQSVIDKNLETMSEMQDGGMQGETIQ
jgi:hypothetical protein